MPQVYRSFRACGFAKKKWRRHSLGIPYDFGNLHITVVSFRFQTKISATQHGQIAIFRGTFSPLLGPVLWSLQSWWSKPWCSSPKPRLHKLARMASPWSPQKSWLLRSLFCWWVNVLKSSFLLKSQCCSVESIEIFILLRVCWVVKSIEISILLLKPPFYSWIQPNLARVGRLDRLGYADFQVFRHTSSDVDA